MSGTDIAVVMAAVPEVTKEVYSDGVKDTLQEVSKLGVDTAKTIRLILFPLQAAAYFQDKMSARIKKALEKVDENKRIEPNRQYFCK